MHQCCIFQSYAKTVPSRMKLTMKLTMREPAFMGFMTTDTWSRRVTYDFNSVFISNLMCSIKPTIQILIFSHSGEKKEEKKKKKKNPHCGAYFSRVFMAMSSICPDLFYFSFIHCIVILAKDILLDFCQVFSDTWFVSNQEDVLLQNFAVDGNGNFWFICYPVHY